MRWQFGNNIRPERDRQAFVQPSGLLRLAQQSPKAAWPETGRTAERRSRVEVSHTPDRGVAPKREFADEKIFTSFAFATAGCLWIDQGICACAESKSFLLLFSKKKALLARASTSKRVGITG